MKTTKAMREELRKNFLQGDFSALVEDGSIGPALLDDLDAAEKRISILEEAMKLISCPYKAPEQRIEFAREALAKSRELGE